MNIFFREGEGGMEEGLKVELGNLGAGEGSGGEGDDSKRKP